MPTTGSLEIRDGYVYVQHAGPYAPNLLRDCLKQAVGACKEYHLTKMLINTTQLASPDMGVVERFRLAVELAKFWDKSIKLALVATERQAAPDQVGAITARNLGLQFELFTDEKAALQWLLAE